MKAWAGTLLLFAVACNAEDINSSAYHCQTDEQCASGFVCVGDAQRRVCVLESLQDTGADSAQDQVSGDARTKPSKTRAATRRLILQRSPIFLATSRRTQGASPWSAFPWSSASVTAETYANWAAQRVAATT